MTLLKNPSEDSLLPAAEPPTPTQHRQTLFQFVQKNIEDLPRTKRADAIVELRQYFNKKHCAEDVEPLKYWKVAIKILTILRRIYK